MGSRGLTNPVSASSPDDALQHDAAVPASAVPVDADRDAHFYYQSSGRICRAGIPSGGRLSETMLHAGLLSRGNPCVICADGQWVFLHPLNVRMLHQEFGDQASMPTTITSKILELDSITQDEHTRRRYKAFGHVPLSGVLGVCEVDMKDSVSAETMAAFSEDLTQRSRQRARRLRKTIVQDKADTAAAAAVHRFEFPVQAPGPSLEELRLMPALHGGDHRDPASGDGEPTGLDASPPVDGVSYAMLTRLGVTATGPALGPDVATVVQPASMGVWGRRAAVKEPADASQGTSSGGVGGHSPPSTQSKRRGGRTGKSLIFSSGPQRKY